MSLLFAVSENVYPDLLQKLKEDGEVSLLSENPYLPVPESAHADMQILNFKGDRVFLKYGICQTFLDDLERAKLRAVISERPETKPLSYPQCCSHNILVCGNYYFHKKGVTDLGIKSYLDSKYYIPVYVNQGYSGCSSLYINDLDLVITSDPGIRKASSGHSFNCYYIDNETVNISLKGYKNGFIGGCAGYSSEDKKLYVNGSLSGELPELYGLLRSAGIKVIEVPEEPLADVGGIALLPYIC